MSRLALGLFVMALGLYLGAGLYETRVVVPFWSSGIPDSLAAGSPLAQVAVAAGKGFWSIVTPAMGLFALLSLGFAFRAPQPRLAWQVAASVLALCAFTMTLAYFKPTAIRLFTSHGAGLSEAALATTVRRWVGWNRVRVGVSVAAMGAGLRALMLL
jgi:hypothetical protein